MINVGLLKVRKQKCTALSQALGKSNFDRPSSEEPILLDLTKGPTYSVP